MPISITGQAPHALSAHDFTPSLTTDPDQPGREYDPVVALTAFAERNLLKPLIPGTPAKAVDTDSGNQLSAEDLGHVLATPLLVDAFSGQAAGDTPDNNAAALDLIAQTTPSVSRHGHPFIRHVFLNQALGQLSLPAPQPGKVVYTAENAVSPSAKEQLALIAKGSSPTAFEEGETGWTTFFTGIAAAFQPRVLGMALLNEDQFTAFGEHLVGIASTLHAAGKVSDETLDKCQQVAKLTLTGLTEALRLRNGNNPTPSYSFPRLLVNSMFSFVAAEQSKANSAAEVSRAAMLPFDLDELIWPEVAVFVNLEKHARLDPSDIRKEWNWIDRQVTGGLKVMSLKNITRLREAANRLSNAQRMAVNAHRQTQEAVKRAAEALDFSKAAPPPALLLRDLERKLKRMGEVNRSQNVQLYKHKTHGRPNRRRPDNPDIPGRIKRQRFLPDIHYFADTSGSMSLEDYMDGALFLMMMAKKFDMNFYFSSHSHYVSEEVLMPVKGKSVLQMKDMLSKVPKATGGNDFSQVYRKIQETPERRRRLSVVATDFGWMANSSHRFIHPDNVVYIPAFNRASPYEWESVKRNAANFINSMRPFDSGIDAKILGMGYAGASSAT